MKTLRRELLFILTILTLRVELFADDQIVFNAGTLDMANANFSMSLSVGDITSNPSSSDYSMSVGNPINSYYSFAYFLGTSQPLAPAAIVGTKCVKRLVISPGRAMTLEWSDSTNLVPVQYRVYLGTDPVNQAELATTGDTKHTVNNLEFMTPYYWKVEAFDVFNRSAMSVVYSFSLSPLIEKFFCAPNPFTLGKENTVFLFTMPGDGSAELSIYSMPHGDLVYTQNLSDLVDGANMLAFDGRDNRGNVLYNGVYVASLHMRGQNGNVIQKFTFVAER